MRFIFFFILLCTNVYIAQSGLLRSYYSKGKIRSEISKADDIYNGTSFWFFRNGNVDKEITYNNGVIDGWVRFYYESGLLKEEFLVKEGARDGEYRGYYNNGALAKVCTYTNGVLSKETLLDEDPGYVAAVDEYRGSYKQYEIRRRKELYLCNIDLCPEPIGGMGAIYTQLEYPAHARLYGLEGDLLLVATVDTDGKVIKTTIAKSLGLGLDEAAKEAVSNTLFKPGKDKDKKVVADVSLKITFSLNNLAQYGSLNPIQVVENGISENGKQPLQEELVTNFQCEIDVCAKPKAGLNAILDNLKIPAIAYTKKLWGEVLIEATVDRFGIVTDTKILKGLGYGLDLEAEIAVLETEFEPGMNKGEYVKSKVKIIVPFAPEKK